MSLLGHEQAIALAVDGIDFGISASEDAMVKEHFAECSGCHEAFKAIKADSEILGTWDWDQTENPDGYEDDDWEEDDEELLPVDYDSDEDEDDSSGSPRSGDGEDEEEDDDAETDRGEEHEDLSSSFDQDEDGDEEDDAERGDGADLEASDFDLDDESGRRGRGEGDADDDADDVASALSDDLDEPDDEEDEEIEREAREFSESLSDEELGDLESDGKDELPACASDGVDEAARDAGVYVDQNERRDAERSIRSQEGIKKTDFGRVAVSMTTRGILRNQSNGKPEKSDAAAAAIRNAVLRSRGGHSAVTRHQPRGRLDNRSLIRIAEHDTRLFKRTSAPSPTPLLVWVLVDVSASMSGQEIRDATAVARAMADASIGTPSMRLAVWGWSDPFVRDAARFAGAVAGVAKVWESGMPTSEVDKLCQLPMGGTPDAPVVDWAWREMKRQVHGDEKPVLVMCSDGWGYGGSLKKVVDTAVTHGVDVRSVAIGHISPRQQHDAYGRGNYIPWQGSIIATARPLATMLMKLAAAK